MNYEKMWNELYEVINHKALTPTINSRTELKHAEELARKQAYLDILNIAQTIQSKHSIQNNNSAYAI